MNSINQQNIVGNGNVQVGGQVQQQQQLTELPKLISSPYAKCLWAKVFEPESRFATENNSAPYYEITMYWPKGDPEALKFLRNIQQYEKLAYKLEQQKRKLNGKKPLPRPYETKIKEEEIDGVLCWTLRAKQDAISKKGKEVSVSVFDCDANPITKQSKTLIGNGSTVIVGMQLSHTSFGSQMGGLSLYLKYVQVIDLVSYEPDDADSLGIQKIPGGYVAGQGETPQSNLPPELQNDDQPTPGFVNDHYDEQAQQHHDDDQDNYDNFEDYSL